MIYLLIEALVFFTAFYLLNHTKYLPSHYYYPSLLLAIGWYAKKFMERLNDNRR